MCIICSGLALLALGLPAFGASSFLGGYSGNIVIPNVAITPAGNWEISIHLLSDVQDEDITSAGLQYGLMPRLEVGVSFLDNKGSEVVFNGKFRLLPETPERPAILVGVFDVAGSASIINDDPGFYLLVSKNVTPVATQIVGEPSKPLTLNLGFGSGLFDGVFAGIDWVLDERLVVMAEYVDEGFDDHSLFNLGARYAVTDAIQVDAAVLDADSFAAGASLRAAF